MTSATAARLTAPILSGGAAVAGAAYVHAVDPGVAGHYPGCPFLMLTGWYCPGCGSLRALHALTSGDVSTALARNPLTVLVVALVVAGWVGWLGRAYAGRPLTVNPSPRLLWAGLGLVAAFWVLRNVPGWTWLSPA